MQTNSWQVAAFRRIFRLAAGLLAGTATAVLAQTTNSITLTNADLIATSSFNTAGNWDSGTAPATGSPDVNAYLTSTNTLRTPADGNDYTFAGDLLEIDGNGGTLAMKGTGTITVDDLILNGGTIQNASTGISPDATVLAGSLHAAAGSTLNSGTSATNSSINILAPISGAGSLNIAGAGTAILSASNSFAGQLQVNSGTLKVNHSNAVPLSLVSGDGIGNLRVNFLAIASSNTNATFDLNGFDVTVNQLITGNSNANTLQPQIINSVVGKTNTLVIGRGDGSGFTWRGRIMDNLGTGGAVALTKVGSGTFNLSVSAGALTYSGDTTFAGGTVNLGNSLIVPWGPGKGNFIVNNPCTVNMSGRSLMVNGFSGDGIIDDTGTTGRSTLNCGSNDVSSVFSGVIQNSQADVGANTTIVSLQKFGSGTITLTGNNSFNGPITINNGILRITQSTGLGSVPKTGNNSITSLTGDAGLHLLGTNGDITLDPGLAFQTAGTNGAIVNEAGNNTINGPISLQTGGGTTIRVDVDTLALAGNINILTNVPSRTLTLSGVTNGIVSGVISDGSSANIPNTNLLSLTKFGPGTWTLTANNLYSDVTTINAGVLALGVSGSISNSSTINVQSGGVFDVSLVAGGWSLGASGGKSLKGSGKVVGQATINGKISPGDALINLPIGALTFSNNLTLVGTALMELNRTNTPANADSIALVGAGTTLTFGGTLTIINIGEALQAGDAFTLFAAATKSGSFSVTNLPALTAGLEWSNSLAMDGRLSVVSTGPVQQPHITGISLSGTNLVISGTNGTAGQQFTELTSTNLALALTNWTPVLTNTFNSGSFTITNTVNPGTPQKFYILRLP